MNILCINFRLHRICELLMIQKSIVITELLFQSMLTERSFLNTPESAQISLLISSVPEFSKLSIADRNEFFRLLNLFAYSDDRNKRNLGISTFVKHLQLIHDFVCKGDAFDSLRGYICGIEFGNNSFMINTGKLKKMMFRSKSCMNGCFQKIGYTVCKPAQDVASLFAQFLPTGCSILSSRQWCVRKATEKTSCFFTPNIQINISTTVSRTTKSKSTSPATSGDNSAKEANKVVKKVGSPCEVRSSPPELFEKPVPNPIFFFDIQYLLNHQDTDNDCIHRM